MHLLIAFLLTVLASVFAQAQDAASSTPSPAPSPTPASYSSCHVDGPYIAMTFDVEAAGSIGDYPKDTERRSVRRDHFIP